LLIWSFTAQLEAPVMAKPPPPASQETKALLASTLSGGSSNAGNSSPLIRSSPTGVAVFLRPCSGSRHFDVQILICECMIWAETKKDCVRERQCAP
jgi:hypothetical protein